MAPSGQSAAPARKKNRRPLTWLLSPEGRGERKNGGDGLRGEEDANDSDAYLRSGTQSLAVPLTTQR